MLHTVHVYAALHLETTLFYCYFASVLHLCSGRAAPACHPQLQPRPHVQLECGSLSCRVFSPSFLPVSPAFALLPSSRLLHLHFPSWPLRHQQALTLPAPVPSEGHSTSHPSPPCTSQCSPACCSTAHVAVSTTPSSHMCCSDPGPSGSPISPVFLLPWTPAPASQGAEPRSSLGTWNNNSPWAPICTHRRRAPRSWLGRRWR